MERLKRIPTKKECLKGTRIRILDELLSWAKDCNEPHVFWLNGMAGTGKTAIALSFVRLLVENQLLGGYFLCSRDGSPEERNVQNILPALSDSLASIFPAFKDARSLDMSTNHSRMINLTLDDQFSFLFSKNSLQRAFGDPSGNTRIPVVVIDALDECQDRHATSTLLEALLSRVPHLPIKFFVTSRPEPHIRSLLETEYPRTFRLHEINEAEARCDISFYLHHELTQVGRRNRIIVKPGSCRSTWPHPSAVETLVQNSGSLFIYAATVVKYIAEHDPEARLERITQGIARCERAITPVYMIYGHILDEAFARLDWEEAAIVKSCLGLIIYSYKSLTPLEVGLFLHIPSHQVRAAFGALHSVINIPVDDSHKISVLHASFPDYLRDGQQRHGSWFLSAEEAHRYLAKGCMETMLQKLYFNIAEAKSSFLLNGAQKLAHISGDIAYACHHWQDHVIASSKPHDIIQLVERLMSTKFLYWVEVLSVLDLVHSAITSLYNLLLSLRKVGLNTFVHTIDPAAP